MNTITNGSRRAGIDRNAAAAGRSVAARAAAVALAATVALGASAATRAAQYGVRVLDGDGEPVAGASVCIGLEGNYRQFGTAFTDVDGWSDFVEVPNIPFVVTVSKTRFTGLRRSEPARGYNVVRELTLVEGQPGPRCRAGSSMVANPPVIDVRDVTVVEDGATTRLTPRVTGSPSEYRLAALGTGFFDPAAGWQRFDTTIDLPPALADASSVLLQLRRYAGSDEAWVEARSDIVTIELPSAEREGRVDPNG